VWKKTQRTQQQQQQHKDLIVKQQPNRNYVYQNHFYNTGHVLSGSCYQILVKSCLTLGFFLIFKF
jgi:hypothetical protein